MATRSCRVVLLGCFALRPITAIPPSYTEPGDVLVAPGSAANSRDTMLAVGGHHVCISLDNGKSLGCWGRNHVGQVGIGKVDRDTEHILDPVSVDVGGRVNQVSLGKFYSCIVRDSGKLMCWGSNSDGQLGDGTREDRWSPKEITMDGQVESVHAGFRHTCAVMHSKELMCWGRNEEGQLGDGTIGVPHKYHGANGHLRPRKVDVGGDVLDVAIGAEHMCVALTGGLGVVKCWGDNTYSQLGNGTRSGNLPRSSVPVDVHIGAEVHRLLGPPKWTTCALLTNGSLTCWGHLAWGFTPTTNPKHSTGLRGNYVESPTLYPATGHLQHVAVGGYHMCTTTRERPDLLMCSGFNNCGQIGDGTMIDRHKPTKTHRLGNQVTHIGLGGGFSCAMRKDTHVLCWGENQDAIMGDGTIAKSDKQWWAPERGRDIGVLKPQEAGVLWRHLQTELHRGMDIANETESGEPDDSKHSGSSHWKKNGTEVDNLNGTQHGEGAPETMMDDAMLDG
jgi:alpha-tubulin suppressor-like RCC1 family protein